MNRRAFLGALSASTVTLSGCTLFADPEDESSVTNSPSNTFSVSVTETPINPGEVASISINAPSGGSIRFTEVPKSSDVDSKNGIELDFTRAEFSPAPDVVWTRDPPTWRWESETYVKGQIPVRVDSNVSPGSYPFSVSVWESGDFEARKTEHRKLVVQSL